MDNLKQGVQLGRHPCWAATSTLLGVCEVVGDLFGVRRVFPAQYNKDQRVLQSHLHPGQRQRHLSFPASFLWRDHFLKSFQNGIQIFPEPSKVFKSSYFEDSQNIQVHSCSFALPLEIPVILRALFFLPEVI